MANKQGSQNTNSVFKTETRLVRIYRREYQLPVFLGDSFQQQHRDIRQRCQLVKEGRPTFLGLSRKPLTVDESIETLNSLLTDYESIIHFIQTQKRFYTQFFSDLVSEIKDITTEKCQKIADLEQKRTILVKRAGQNQDLQLIYSNQQAQLLKAAQLVGSASLLMLKKLELIQDALAKLADDQEVQRQVFDEMLGHLNIYTETHRLQKEIADIQLEAADMAKTAIDFDKYIGNYLGSLQGFISEVVKIDQKLSIALEEIKGLTDMILDESEMFSINSDKELSEGLMIWLTQSALKENRLADALKDVEKQPLSAAEMDLQLLQANTESDSVSETLTKIQAYLEPIFNQLNFDADAYYGRGNAYFDLKDYDRAIADYNQALKLNPNYVYAYYGRGNAYFDLKDYDRAIADYTEALKLNPNYALAYINRGFVYYKLKNYDRAIDDYNQALTLDPNNALAYSNRELACRDLKDDRITAEYNQSLKLDLNKAINPPPSATPTVRVSVSDNLSSDVGVDYTQLRDLLAAQKWKDADHETYLVMLKVVGRSKGGWLERKELLNFPCTDLRTIDRLWVKYSNGRFGISVQKKIYLEVGGIPNGRYNYEVWKKFADRVGWRERRGGLTFDTSAPAGHLPLPVCVSMWEASLLSRPDL